MSHLELLSAPLPVAGTLTRDFLQWLAAAPRTYGETMDAWRSSCPRFTVWEDALADRLVRVVHRPGIPMRDTAVVLTPSGLAILNNGA